MKKANMLLSASVIILALAPAHAQTTDGDVAKDQIVVTATKRAQRLQEVPLAVTAIDEQTIARAGIQNYDDYARIAPGVSFELTGPGGGQFSDRALTIRGIASSLVLAGAAAQPTGFYINDTPVPLTNPSLFDIERIEVLRGPQGTLYGAGSMGGTVKVITNQPNTSEFEALAGGSVDVMESGGVGYTGRGMLNIPVFENQLAVRLTGEYRKDSGYIDNYPVILNCADPGPACETGGDDFSATNLGLLQEDFNDLEQATLRVSALWTPVENLSIRPSVFYQNTDIGGDSTFSLVNGEPVFGYTTHYLAPTPENDEFVLYDFSFDYDFGFATLTNSTSWFDRTATDSMDLTPLMRAILSGAFPDPDDVARGNGLVFPFASEINQQLFNQEVRLTSPGGQFIDWVIGGFYQKESTDTFFSSYSNEVANDPEFSMLIPSGNISNGAQYTDTQQFAVFGEAIINLTDRLAFTGGVRWFDLEIQQTTASSGFFVGGSNSEIAPIAAENGFNPKVEVSFQATDDHLFYALASKGFRAGGNNIDPETRPGCPAELNALGFDPLPNDYDSDKLWNYEAGAKTQWADGKITLNTAVYMIDWTDIQQPCQLACGYQITLNSGKARSKGVEIEAQFQPGNGLDWYGNVTVASSSLTEDNLNGVGQEGDYLANSPKLAFATGLQYSFPNVRGFTPYIRGDYQYVGKTYVNFSPLGGPRAQNARDAYDVASFRVGVSSDGWDASLYLRNAFNEMPIFGSGAGAVAQFPQGTTLQPRTVGIALARRW